MDPVYEFVARKQMQIKKCSQIVVCNVCIRERQSWQNVEPELKLYLQTYWATLNMALPLCNSDSDLTPGFQPVVLGGALGEPGRP